MLRSEKMKKTAAILLLVLLACTSASETALRALVGKNIGDYISERHVYPDSVIDLPSGGKAYRFSKGSGGHVDQRGNYRSNVCTWWLETDVAGTITHWRYENCN